MAKRLSVVDTERCVGCQLCMFACARRYGESGIARSAIHVRSAGGVERGFIVVVCRACKEPSCAAACPTGALKPRNGGGVIIDYSKCIGCGMCRKACPIGAVMWDEELNKPVICVHCGYCINYCVHEVLALTEVKE